MAAHIETLKSVPRPAWSNYGAVESRTSKWYEKNWSKDEGWQSSAKSTLDKIFTKDSFASRLWSSVFGGDTSKDFNPDQPRDPEGRFASGGAAADTGDGTGAQGTSPSSPEPRVYADASDAAEFQDKYKSWTKNLSSDELSAVARYSETDSIQINAKLRGKKADVEALAATLGEDVVRTPEEIDDAIKQIDSAIEKAPALDESIKVYRTFNDDFVRKNYKKLSGGIVEAGYTSTTILKENLDHIPRGKDAMTAEITIPKGAKGAYIGSNINDLAEDEFLLPKRSYYQFTGSSKDKATGHITVQMTYDPHFWDT
jgi:hypothetical protein